MGLLLGAGLCFPIRLNAEQYRPGFCPLTGNRIIDGDRILPNYQVVWFELDNGSRMPLAVDISIAGNIVPANFDRIMEYVRAGWQWEINQKKWTTEQIQMYKDNYFNLKIIKVLE